jgi:hypothetical protein
VEALDDVVKLVSPVGRLAPLPEPQPVLGLVVQVQGDHFLLRQNQRAQPQVDVPALAPVGATVFLVVRIIVLIAKHTRREKEPSPPGLVAIPTTYQVKVTAQQLKVALVPKP